MLIFIGFYLLGLITKFELQKKKLILVLYINSNNKFKKMIQQNTETTIFTNIFSLCVNTMYITIQLRILSKNVFVYVCV